HWQDRQAFQDRPEGEERPDWRSHFRRHGHGDGNPLRRDPQGRIGGGVALAVGLASLLAVFLLLAGVLNDGSIEVYCWPQVVSVACLTLIWRNAPEDEKAGMRHMIEPLESLGGADNVRRGSKLR